MFICGYAASAFADSHLMHFFVQTNFVLFVFNLIPCVPLDGSEILRSAVSARRGIINSYRSVKKISLVITTFFFALGALYLYAKANPSLLVIAVLAAQSVRRRNAAVICAAKEIFLGNIRSNPNRIKTVRFAPEDTVSKAVRYVGFCYTLRAEFECGGKMQALSQDDIIRAARVNPCAALSQLRQKREKYCIKSDSKIENGKKL